MAIGGFCISLFLMMAVFIGVATLAFYDGRDALCEIPIRPDQIVPTLIIDMFRDTHGFQEIFLQKLINWLISKIRIVFGEVLANFLSLSLLLKTDNINLRINKRNYGSPIFDRIF